MRGLAVCRGNIFNDATIAVFTHDSLARLAGKPLVEAFFNAFNPLAIHVGEANQVRGDFAGRIITAGFFPQMNAGQLEFFNVVSHIRVHLTGKIDEAPFRVGVNA